MRLPIPAADKASSTPKPNVTPSRCGIDLANPNSTPDEVSMMLFGPGVIDDTNANNANGNKVSMIPCSFGAGDCRTVFRKMMYPKPLDQYSTDTLHEIIPLTVTVI